MHRVKTAAAFAGLLALCAGASLADIDHVVLFMQENRAFDHYFGTMAGVRGFADANLQMNGDQPVWNQKTNKGGVDYVKPWYLNYLGGNWTEATQCMYAGSNGWTANHKAYNHGANDRWALDQNPWSIGFYKQDDLPLHFALAENWIIGDMYQESVISATRPNRVTWLSGSINVPGGPQTPDQGGNPYIDNNDMPGCEDGINCFPLKWKTTGEMYEEAGVSWSVFQNDDNFDDNQFIWFKQFIEAKPGSALHAKGVKGQTLGDFFARAANGTLPAISYVVGPAELSEHPPYSPNDGAWFQKQIADAVLTSPSYNKTALIVSYDETGGWFDHLDPFRSPDGTGGEWLDDPYGDVGHTFAGPGFRVPFYIISPFTRKGGVYTEHTDHNSQILFIEKWQAAKGVNVTTSEMVHWRRENMGDLANAFDFENPDYSIPPLPDMPAPHKNANGNWDGSSYCSSRYNVTRPPVPYKDGAVDDMASLVEHGYKSVRGRLTEGRHLVFELGPLALTAQKCGQDSKVRMTLATPGHEKPSQRWVVYAVELGRDDFTIGRDGLYICGNGILCADQSKAVVFTVGFIPSHGHTFEVKDTGKYLSTGESQRNLVGEDHSRNVLTLGGDSTAWKVFSVNY